MAQMAAEHAEDLGRDKTKAFYTWFAEQRAANAVQEESATPKDSQPGENQPGENQPGDSERSASPLENKDTQENTPAEENNADVTAQPESASEE